MSERDAIWRREDFTVLKEDWHEYALADGTRVRVKPVMRKIATERHPDGEYMRTENGEPHINIDAQWVVEVVDRPGYQTPVRRAQKSEQTH